MYYNNCCDFQCNELKLFAAPYRWIITNSNDTRETITHLFSKINILVDSEVIIVTKDYSLTKIYKLTTNSKPIVESFGYWEKDLGLNITEKERITAKRRKNLSGTVLNTCIVITNNDTFNHLTDKR